MDSLLVRMRGSRTNDGHYAAAARGARRYRQRTVSQQRIGASFRSPRLSPIVRHLGEGDTRLRRVATRSAEAEAAPASPRLRR